MTKDTPRTARQRAYAEIVAEAKAGLARYYAEYPDRLGDERGGDAVAWSTRGVSRILLLLDKYSIEDMPNPAQPATQTPPQPPAHPSALVHRRASH